MDITSLVKEPNKFSEVSVKDIDDIAIEFSKLLEPKIDSTCMRIAIKTTFGDMALPKAAFKCAAKDTVNTAIRTYCAHEKWKQNVPIVSYISSALNVLVKKTINDIKCVNRKVVGFVCPACKEFGVKEPLEKDKKTKTFICKNCLKQINYLEEELSKIEDKTLERSVSLKNKIEFLKVFCKHTLKGFKCNECKKFIPNSYNESICPYPFCRKPIDYKNIISKNHPITFSKRRYVYFNNKMQENSEKEFGEIYCASGGNAYDLLSSKEKKSNDYKSLINIILKQKKVNTNTRKIPTKNCMYSAFIATMKDYPEEMSDYLINGGQNGDISIQATIFQKFIDIIESKLPIVLFSKGVQIRIEDLLDSRLHIFNGKRKFVNFIDHDLIVKKKNQKEITKDGVEIENNSDHFIGKIISIKSEGKDISHLVDSYSFSKIKMKFSEELNPGADVEVEYYSLYPSYVMGSLIHLQRIKKKVSESINRNK